MPPAAVRVLHVTDPHLSSDKAASLRGTVTYMSLKNVLEHIRNSGWPADLVALTGDLIQDDSEGAYRNLEDLMKALELPVLAVPGNHDVRALMRAVLQEPPFAYCGSMRRANWLILGIDSCVHGRVGGRIADGELDRLRTEIAATDAEHVLVCLHHPPLPVGSRWLDSIGLENGREFLQTVAASGKVRAAIFGHVHQPFEATRSSVRVIGTPSTCRQFKVGSDEFAVDQRPPAYRRLDLHADGRVESRLIWLENELPD